MKQTPKGASRPWRLFHGRSVWLGRRRSRRTANAKRRPGYGALTVSIVPRVFAFVWEVSPTLFVALILILLFNAFAPAAMAWLSMKVIVDGVVEATTSGSGWMALTVPVAAVFTIWAVNAALASADVVVRRLLQQKTEILESVKLLNKAGSLDIAFFETPRFYDQLHQAVQQRWTVHHVANQSLGLLQRVVSLTAMLSLLSVLHPIAIVVLLATALPSLLMQGYFAKQRNDYFDEIVRGARVQEYIHDLLTSRQAANEVRIFSLAPYLVGRFLGYANAQFARFWTRERRILTAEVVLSVLSLVGTAAIWVFAISRAVAARISLGDLTLVFTASIQCRTQLEGLVNSTGEVFEHSLLAARYFQFLDLDPESVTGTLTLPQTPSRPLPKPLAGQLELRDVSFAYPGSEARVLERLSFVIPSGAKVAIVGENGAGKTTIVKLLARLYDPTGGRILFDGHDLRDYELNDVRSAVSIVFQDFVRYEFSVADNIGFGDIAAANDRDRIESTARRTGAHPTIAKLPDGYDTMLGKTYDEGVDLSGGEWQFLAIARALMSNAKILILDEPTAALDALKEQELYERFATLTESRTVVFISHRFSTVRMADLIVVLDDGRVVESGAHDELIALDGKYARMYETQAARYATSNSATEPRP